MKNLLILALVLTACGREDKKNLRTFVENTKVKPASISVPPGDLPFPGDISITTTDPFMTPQAKTILLNDSAYQDATKAILVTPQYKQNAIAPMTISITLNDSQLALFNEGNLKVVYNTFDAHADKDNWGLFEGNQLTVIDNQVYFRTTHFGHFQGIRVDN